MARTHRDRAFASLAHVPDLKWMLEAYRTTRKDGCRATLNGENSRTIS